MNMFSNMFGTKSYEDLNSRDFKEKMEADENAVLLDVRTPGEFNDGFIEGAINIDIMSPYFNERISELDKSKTYYVYCRSGGRSGQACSVMSNLGFKTYNLAGGIMSWPY